MEHGSINVQNWLDNYHTLCCVVNAGSYVENVVDYIEVLNQQKQMLIYAINCLPSTECQIIKMHYLEDMSYSEIGKRLGYVKDVVYRKCKKAITRLDFLLNNEEMSVI